MLVVTDVDLLCDSLDTHPCLTWMPAGGAAGLMFTNNNICNSTTLPRHITLVVQGSGVDLRVSGSK